MSNLSYWERRQIEDIYQQMESAEDCADEISKLYRKASRYLSLQADAIFERFQTKHNLTDQEARRLLSAMQDRTSLDEMLNKLKNTSSSQEKAELIKKLEAPAYRARLERLRQLQNQIDYMMKDIYQQELDFSTSHYIDLANEAYYRSIYRLQQRAEAAFSFNHISAKQIDKVVGSRWSGRNYSERIWKNTRALAQDLKEELLINLVTGRTNREVAEIIANKFGQGSFNARRLVRTESNFVATQMNFEAYEDAGIEEYQYLATLDLRTSQVCRELDGQIFPVKEKKVGTNCPPMHPWCRSTTISVVTREWIEDMQRSALDPATGKKIKVPRSMNYQQWYDTYVKGKPEEGNNAVAKFGGSGIIEKNGDARKMNLQFFAEKDIKNQESNSLKRAIRHYEQRIAEHESYINNPKNHVPDWDELTEVRRNGLIRHWNKEIRNFQTSINDRVTELKERGDFNE